MKFKKYAGNPILGPKEENTWEASVATNPAAWYDEEKEEFILIYRAAGHDDRHVVQLGMAKSKDGFHFERCSDEPIFSPPESGHDMGCMEDPRIVKFGDYYFITYASRPFYPGKYWEAEPSVRVPNCIDEFPVALKGNLTSTNLLMPWVMQLL